MNDKCQSSNNKRYDLEGRTARFGDNIIDFAKKIKRGTINRVLVSQVVRAGTSIGQIIWKQMEQSQKEILNIK